MSIERMLSSILSGGEGILKECKALLKKRQ